MSVERQFCKTESLLDRQELAVQSLAIIMLLISLLAEISPDETKTKAMIRPTHLTDEWRVTSSEQFGENASTPSSMDSTSTGHIDVSTKETTTVIESGRSWSLRTISPSAQSHISNTCRHIGLHIM